MTDFVTSIDLLHHLIKNTFVSVQHSWFKCEKSMNKEINVFQYWNIWVLVFSYKYKASFPFVRVMSIENIKSVNKNCIKTLQKTRKMSIIVWVLYFSTINRAVGQILAQLHTLTCPFSSLCFFCSHKMEKCMPFLYDTRKNNGG